MGYYGVCEKCGADMQPVWFTEEEYKVTNDGFRYRTGRERRAVSHLECPYCFAKACVDDTFDGAWH